MSSAGDPPHSELGPFAAEKASLAKPSPERCRCEVHDKVRRYWRGVRHAFETSSGTVEVTVHEESRTVSTHRLDADGRTVAAAIESWDHMELADVLTRQIGISATEAADIASRVRTSHPRLRTPPPELEQVPSLQRDLSHLENAGVPLRFVAVLLDAVIVFFPIGIVVGLLSGGGYSEVGNGYANAGVNVGGDAVWLLLALGLAYYILCEATTGMTVGKRLVGIRVVDDEGDPLGLGAAVVRNVLRLVDGLFFYLVGALFALTSPRGQRLGDRAAHTLVVRR
jgi:uncharacterized RDD family membrane protein YckC